MAEHSLREQMTAYRAELVAFGKATCARLHELEQALPDGASYRLMGRLGAVQDTLADAIWQIDAALSREDGP